MNQNPIDFSHLTTDVDCRSQLSGSGPAKSPMPVKNALAETDAVKDRGGCRGETGDAAIFTRTRLDKDGLLNSHTEYRQDSVQGER